MKQNEHPQLSLISTESQSYLVGVLVVCMGQRKDIIMFCLRFCNYISLLCFGFSLVCCESLTTESFTFSFFQLFTILQIILWLSGRCISLSPGLSTNKFFFIHFSSFVYPFSFQQEFLQPACLISQNSVTEGLMECVNDKNCSW